MRPYDPNDDALLADQFAGAKAVTLSTNGKGALPATIKQPLPLKAQILKALQPDIPKNDFGLPTFIYRADLLPMHALSLPDAQDAQDDSDNAQHELTPKDVQALHAYLELAVMELDYNQGFPMQPDGELFWSQLPYETPEAYLAFTHYLNLPRTKGENGYIMPDNAMRQLSAVKAQTQLSMYRLMEMSYLYYWPQRAIAYDLFITVAHNKRREYMMQDVENEHLALASKYLHSCMEFIDNAMKDPESSGIAPRDAMNFLVKMVQIQRLSLGASPFGQKSGKDEHQLPQNASVQVILQQISQQAGMQSAHSAESAGAQQKSVMEQLLQNPEDLAAAQELIVRISDAQNPRTGLQQAVPNGHLSQNAKIIDQDGTEPFKPQDK